MSSSSATTAGCVENCTASRSCGVWLFQYWLSKMWMCVQCYQRCETWVHLSKRPIPSKPIWDTTLAATCPLHCRDPQLPNRSGHQMYHRHDFMCCYQKIKHIPLWMNLTGVAPFSGATTGTGGRIRDIQSAGRGGHVIAGTAGYCFGNLHIPG